MAASASPQYPEWVPGVEIDHVTAARTHLRSIFPEASLNPNSVEMTLIESLAVELGPVALAHQSVPAAVVEHLMALYGVYRYSGRKAVGKARFRVSSAADRVNIPRGTHLRYNVDDYAGALDFYTTETINISTSETLEADAYIEAAENGTIYNGVLADSPLDTVDYMMDVEAVSISETTRAGEDREDNDSFEERARSMLSRQTSALVYAEQFRAAALVREEVGRAFPVNNYDAATQTSKTGHVTVAVTDNTGLPIPPAEREAILAELQSQVVASLVVHVTDPTYTTVNVSVVVEAAPGTNHAEVQAAVRAELERRLDPMRWDWWSTITNLDLASWIDEVPGVARIISVPTAITLTGVAPLPRAGAITVVVNDTTR